MSDTNDIHPKTLRSGRRLIEDDTLKKFKKNVSTEEKQKLKDAIAEANKLAVKNNASATLSTVVEVSKSDGNQSKKKLRSSEEESLCKNAKTAPCSPDIQASKSTRFVTNRALFKGGWNYFRKIKEIREIRKKKQNKIENFNLFARANTKLFGQK